jgi:hypothetical protein
MTSGFTWFSVFRAKKRQSITTLCFYSINQKNESACAWHVRRMDRERIAIGVAAASARRRAMTRTIHRARNDRAKALAGTAVEGSQPGNNGGSDEDGTKAAARLMQSANTVGLARSAWRDRAGPIKPCVPGA